MYNKITINPLNEIILIFDKNKNEWEDKTNSIKAIYKSFYYGNHSGYDIYYNFPGEKYFYKKSAVNFLKHIENIEINNVEIYVNKQFVDVMSLQRFTQGYYRVYTTSDNIIVSNKIDIFDGKNLDLFAYYESLANYAETITNDEEPLYYLAKNYKRLLKVSNSVLQHFLTGTNVETPYKGLIYTPFSTNKSQIKAIRTALENKISVIEGPPGTGKTQTIINLIINLLMSGKKCAVISNNNTAIDNVFEKLQEEDLDFFVARLGRKESVDDFFLKQGEIEYKKSSLISNVVSEQSVMNQIKSLNTTLTIINNNELEIAKFNNELEEIRIELNNFNKINFENTTINSKLEADDYESFIRRLEKAKRIGFFERLGIRMKYKVSVKTVNLICLINSAERLYYEKSLIALENKINNLQPYIDPLKKKRVMDDLKEKILYLLAERQKRYMSKVKTDAFNRDTYQRHFRDFIQRYPVILSTTQSLFNNLPDSFVVDYLIIDEASQGDLLSSILTMNSATNLVVVGDSKQLQQIDEKQLFSKSVELAEKLNVAAGYQYANNSILSSVLTVIKDVPVTLLSEHYRSVPAIINFCNEMFYDGELIPMRQNSGTHLEIVKTVPGNHARKNPSGSGLYNQREIDEIKYLVNGKSQSDIAVITPFRYQAQLIRETYRNLELEADTIHKYQGQQRNEIILSFVANDLKNDELIENRLYDFLTNEKLFNVAISRAKNKVTILISDKIYYSENNIIKDFINYAEYLYSDKITKEAKTKSVFDYLYKNHNHGNKKYQTMHTSERLFKLVIDDVIKDHKFIDYQMHVRLGRIISDISMFSVDEQKYLNHPWTHVDYLFFNKVTKKVLFVVEVDGIKFHEQNIKQLNRDYLKDNALNNNNVSVYRFKTNESNEKERLEKIFKQYTY